MNNTQDLKEIMSKNIKSLLNRKGVSQTMMAKDLNIPEMTVSNWIKGKTYPRPDKIQLMADYFGVNRSDLTEDYPSNIVYPSLNTTAIPILGKIACGLPLLVQENIVGYVYESSDFLPPGEHVYIDAEGDSMSPTIPHGARVLVRQQPEVENGEIAAVVINGGTEATLKRVKKQGDTLLLMPDNPIYDPIIIDNRTEARIIGKAIKISIDL